MIVQEKSICEPTTFETVFNTNSQIVHNFIYYKCKDRQQAEDITQEAFIKLWKNCGKIQFEKAKSFLFTVAKNTFFNEVAHLKVVQSHQKSFLQRKNIETPHYLLEEKEFLNKLDYTISQLSEKQREVFLLNRIEKKKYSEIAELLDISVKAVEKRMSTALKILRDKLGKI